MHEFQNKKSSTSSNYFLQSIHISFGSKCIYVESLCIQLWSDFWNGIILCNITRRYVESYAALLSPSFVCSLPTFLITQFKEKERNLSSKVHLWCSTKENKNCWLVESIFSLKPTKPYLYTYAQNQIYKNKNGKTF